jgi:putative NADH-flavin reductase
VKIALFGATGRTGQHILQAALADGHQVHVLVRSPSKLTLSSQAVVVFVGDALDVEIVKYTMRECDVVASALGLTDPFQPEALSQGTANIITAMESLGLQRLVAVAGAGILRDRKTGRLRLESPTFNPAYLPYAREHLRMLELLTRSHLDWTLVCPPAMREAPAAPLRVEVNALPEGGRSAAYAAVGAFVYRLLSSSDFIHQCVGVAE